MSGEYSEGVPLPINPKAEADINEAIEKSDIPKPFAEWKSHGVMSAHEHMRNARVRLDTYKDNPQTISDDYPGLEGYEDKMLEAVHRVAAQDISDAGTESRPATIKPPATFTREDLPDDWISPEERKRNKERVEQERERIWIEGFNKMGENARRAYEAKHAQKPSPAAPEQPTVPSPTEQHLPKPHPDKPSTTNPSPGKPPSP
jgi:hypothetical protein